MWQPASLQAKKNWNIVHHFPLERWDINEIWKNNLMRISAIQIKYDIGGWKESKEHWGESWQADIAQKNWTALVHSEFLPGCPDMEGRELPNS